MENLDSRNELARFYGRNEWRDGKRSKVRGFLGLDFDAEVVVMLSALIEAKKEKKKKKLNSCDICVSKSD